MAMALIREHGKEAAAQITEVREATDKLLRGTPAENPLMADTLAAGATGAMAEELARTASWLNFDRAMLDRRFTEACQENQIVCWMQHALLLEKFDVRVDVLIDACTRALGQFVDSEAGQGDQAHDNPFNLGLPRHGETQGEWLLLLFQQYAHCKEALGRLRSFVCAGGKHCPSMIRSSFKSRRRLTEIIEHKDRMLQRVLSTECSRPTSAENPGAFTAEAVHKMLADVCGLEWDLMGCFAASTPLELMHVAIASRHDQRPGEDFDINNWWGTLSRCLDLMVSLDQVLAAFICAH